MKKSVIFILALTLIMATVLTGCGGSSVVGTYTFTPAMEDVAANTQHQAFLADGVPSQVNTLVLNKDGTYSLDKKVDEDAIHLYANFTGTYTVEKGVVTLKVPTDVSWDLDWAQFIEQEYFPGVIKGQLSKGDTKIDCGRNSFNYIGGGHEPTYMFLTPYLMDSEKTGDVQITVNAKDKTFDYVAVASSEDD
jgi:hypothetical protein